MKQSDIAEALKLTPGSVSKLVKRGMPTDSVDAAKAWRAEHLTEGVGHKASHPAVTAAAQALKSTPPPAPDQPIAEDEPDAPLVRLRETERRAHAMVEAALTQAEKSKKADDYAALPGLIRIHSTAVANRLEAERAQERHRLRTGQLVTVDFAQGLIAERLGPLDAQLRNLPRLVAAAANPAEPQIAERAITQGLYTIFKQLNSKP